MQVAQLVDVTDVHVLLVDLRFVEVLGFYGKKQIEGYPRLLCVELFMKDFKTTAAHVSP